MKPKRTALYLAPAFALLFIPHGTPLDLRAETEADTIVVVEPGETIDSFARRYLKKPREWKQVLKANNMTRAAFAPGAKIKITPARANPGQARVLSFREEARYSPSVSETWRKIHEGMKFFKLDRLRTDSSGRIRLRLRNKMTVDVKPETRLIIQVSERKNDSGLFLQNGRIRSFSTTEKMLNFRVITPAAKIKVSGTDFTTDVKKDGTTMVECYKGAVIVSARGREVNVKAGFRITVQNGRAPGVPERHSLPPPEIN